MCAHAHDVCLMLMCSEDTVCVHTHMMCVYESAVCVCTHTMCVYEGAVCVHAHDVCFVTIVLPVTDSFRFNSSSRCCESKGRTSRSP